MKNTFGGTHEKQNVAPFPPGVFDSFGFRLVIGR